MAAMRGSGGSGAPFSSSGRMTPQGPPYTAPGRNHQRPRSRQRLRDYNPSSVFYFSLYFCRIRDDGVRRDRKSWPEAAGRAPRRRRFCCWSNQNEGWFDLFLQTLGPHGHKNEQRHDTQKPPALSLEQMNDWLKTVTVSKENIKLIQNLKNEEKMKLEVRINITVVLTKYRLWKVRKNIQIKQEINIGNGSFPILYNSDNIKFSMRKESKINLNCGNMRNKVLLHFLWSLCSSVIIGQTEAFWFKLICLD